MTMNLKSISTFAAIALFAPVLAFSEIHEYNRRVEFGMEAEAGFSNNVVSASDVLVKELVIDLQEFDDKLPRHGLTTEFMLEENNYFNMDINGKFRLGFFAGASGSGYLNLGRGMFDFLAKGLEVGDSYEATMNIYTDLYLNAGASFRTNIGGLGITLKPTYFVPLVYIPNTKATFSWDTSSSGKLQAKAKANLSVYSAVNLEKLFGDGDEEDDETEGGNEGDDEDESDLQIKEEIMNALSRGGVDLTFGVEYPFIGRVLEAGIYGRIPLIPGKLDYSMSKEINASVYTSENGLIDVINGNSPETEMDVGDTTYSDEPYKLHRPLKFGFEGVYRPHGDTFLVYSMLGFAIRSPFSNSVKMYPEYAVTGTAKFYNFLGLTLGMKYTDMVFSNQLNFMINTHIFELDTGVALRSPHFFRSFTGAGASVYVALKFGI